MAKRKKTHILNYRVVVEPDTYTGSKKTCYTAYCPSLGVADSGETIEEALKNLKALIKFHLKCLVEEGIEIPKPDMEEGLVTMTKVDIEGEPNFAYL